MGRLQQYLVDEPKPTRHEVGFNNRMTETLVQLVAQDTVNRLTPFIQALAQQIEANGGRADAGTEQTNKALDAAAKALEGAVADQIKSVQSDLTKAVKRLTEARKGDMKALEKALSSGFGGIDVPDYSDTLNQIAAAQPVILSAIKDNEPEGSPKEWDFDIKRNRNGFIQSVTAKAK